MCVTSKRKAKGMKQAEVQRSGGRADGVFQQRAHGPLGPGKGEPTSGPPNHPLLSISHILSTCQENTPESLSHQPPHPNLCVFHNTTYPYVLKISSSLVAQLVKNLPLMQETPVQFLGWEDPLEKG